MVMVLVMVIIMVMLVVVVLVVLVVVVLLVAVVVVLVVRGRTVGGRRAALVRKIWSGVDVCSPGTAASKAPR